MIKTWTTDEILHATGGELLLGETEHYFSGISIDSRKISNDNLFVAIKGEVHDGHRFIQSVIKQGGRGLIIDENKANELPRAEWREKGVVCIAVTDTTTALGDLAAFNRRRSDVSVVAITGSNGKTTTRKMTATVVAQRFSTLSSRGSFNNEIGLPLTLFNLEDSHEWAVLELGMNNPGEISKLADICLPDIGVITNIGPAHIGKLGSMEGIMNAKGELLEKISPGGIAILNADDPRVLKLKTRNSELETRNKIILFGLSRDSLIRAISVKEEKTGVSFTLSLPTESIPIHLGNPGTFMVSNALAAASVGYALGLSAQEIKTGLEAFEPVRGRMNHLKTKQGISIIDDTYNANPGSMEAAIMALRSLKGAGRGIFVSGDMRELGEYAESMHRKLGSLASGTEVAKLYVTGEFAEAVATGARDKGMESCNIFIGTKREIIEDLIASLKPDDCVLVKGSRAMKMEEIINALI
ncbi:UDP-N-acetylmuramoyl-tripeptide--D-alanyl-D-alanine ligase [Desulfonema magnum]|uniref:UDP-N-acetylmuramoyl-tripeptide--D-alanyl-D-alanine ligase n=1 Tax=Desulfonema magnum TaxID=45655 RepID=A0A975GJY8_9BACT|nr:UDP-N-acetylmuramoyl-tripeptide--D-alanyl-D-alanine ligase [Desulfonema magnum]QTA84057.1 UDP-N-acetylmuramoyl-tripeptide--D-alanyl-D-alanine ligase [Desulfonema magnum]